MTCPPLATGDDRIPIRFISMIADITFPILTHIINLTIIFDKLPNERKIATTSPTYEDGDTDCFSNYGPISILPAISKIFEHIVHTQIYNHINEHILPPKAQFGFKNYHSTETCIMKLRDSVYKNMEPNLLNGVVFLDLKKALDMVDHIPS